MDRTICYIGLGYAIALLVCLCPMPYGYYNFIRFAGLIIFVMFSVSFYDEGKKALSLIFASLALLFQPFVKIVLGKTIWQIVDVVVALGLIAIWIISLIETQHNKKK